MVFDKKTREVFIYNDIGPAEFGMFGTETLLESLKALGDGPVTLRINSYGGSVDEALAMIEILSRHDGEVDVTVDSIAASAASLFPAYFPSSAAPHARIMIHNPWGVAMGDAEEFRKQADILDMYRDSLIHIYENAMGVDRSDIQSILDAETWYNASDAVLAGLVDEVGVGSVAVEAPEMPQNRFKNVPNDLTVKPAAKAEEAAEELPEVSGENLELTTKLAMLRLKCKLKKSS